MAKVHLTIDRILKVFLALSLAVLVFVTFGQVVGRYVFVNAVDIPPRKIHWLEKTIDRVPQNDEYGIEIAFAAEEIPEDAPEQ